MIEAPTLLVLAAGMGSRYGGLKQLEPMGPNDETLLDYSVYDAMQAGFGRIVFVIHHDLEAAFRDTIGKRYERRIPIEYAFQELDDLPAGYAVPEGRQKPWGTGHALLAARGSVMGTFAVINADDFYGADAYGVLNRYFEACHTADREPLGLVAYSLANTLSENGTVNRGVCKASDGRLAGVEEAMRISRDASGRITGQDGSGSVIEFAPDTLVSMNCWAFSAAIFPHLESRFGEFLATRGSDPGAEFYIPAFVDELIQNGSWQCDLLRTSAQWFGVTYPADRPGVQERLRQLTADGAYPSPLLA